MQLAISIDFIRIQLASVKRALIYPLSEAKSILTRKLLQELQMSSENKQREGSVVGRTK